MNVKIDGATARVTLSRRNLLTLLAKLDGHPGESKRTIYRTNDEGETLVVTAEEDDAHYGARGYGPGAMHPETEKEIVRG